MKLGEIRKPIKFPILTSLFLFSVVVPSSLGKYVQCPYTYFNLLTLFLILAQNTFEVIFFSSSTNTVNVNNYHTQIKFPVTFHTCASCYVLNNNTITVDYDPVKKCVVEIFNSCMVILFQYNII